MKYLKITFISVFSIALGIVLLSAISFWAIKTFYLTPEQLTRLVKQELNERTNLQFDCQSIELSYWDTWPTVSISIKKGEVKLPTAESGDSVKYALSGTFERITSSLQLAGLLKNREININNIQVYEPEVCYVSGRRLLPIAKPKKQGSGQKVRLQINRVKVHEGTLSYQSKKGHRWDLSQANAEVTGELDAQTADLDVVLQIPRITSNLKLVSNKNLSLTFNSHCTTTNRFKSVTLEGAKFNVNGFPFSLDGAIKKTEKGKAPFVDVKFGLMAVNLQDLMDFLPEELMAQCKNYEIEGKIALDGSVKGTMVDSIVPDIKLAGFIQEGTLVRKDMPYGIDKLSLQLRFNHLNSDSDSSFLAIDNLKAEGLGSNVDMRCMISNPLTAPFVAADISGHLNLNRLSKEFLPKNTTEMEGEIKMDMACAFLWDDLVKQKFQHVKIQGDFLADKITASNEKARLNLFTTNVNINIGNRKNKSDFIAGDEVLSGEFDIDTLNIVYKQAVNINLSQLHVRSNTVLAKSRDAAVQPITAHIDCASLRAKTNKSQWITGDNIEIHAGSKAVSGNPQKEERGLFVKANTIKYVDTERQDAAVLRNSSLISEWRPSSAQTGKWDIKGIVELKNSQLYTAKFPLKLDVRQGFLHFQNDRFTLNRFEIRAGESDCMLSGAFAIDSRTKKLIGSLQVSAQYINYDELNQTFLYGKAATQKKVARAVQDLTIDNFEQKIQNIHKAETKITDRSVYIPKNLSLDIVLDINESNYKEVILQQVKGNIFLKDQKALADLSTRTNLGKASIRLLYDSRKRGDIKTVFDADFKDILVAQMHTVIPTIATMLPLTKSMDGLANCHITAYTQLDSQMLPVLTSTKAVCSFSGQKLEFFDNKTFQEIAKRFRFRNKKDRVLRQLATNIVMNDGKIEVIPFSLEWDRYRAIVGGTHGIDMTYDYHVDILKSPIPIDFGVNITGNENDLKYKISKCRYKDLFKDGGVQYNKEVNQKVRKIRQGLVELITL